MIWFRRRQKEALREATLDVEVAKEQRKNAEKSLEYRRSKWLDTMRIVSESREIRHENHLAEAILSLFRSH